MRRTFPRPLKKGDVVAVAAPAGPVDPKRLERGLRRLAEGGFVPEIAEGILARDGFFAGSDAHRAASYNWALAVPEGRAVMAARGGYGTMWLLPRIGWKAFARRPRILVGYSDLSAFLSYAATRLGVPTVHGPMTAADLAVRFDAEAFDAFARLAAGDVGAGEAWGSPCARVRAGAAEGILAGGCLSVLTALLGTPWEPDFRGALLFLEDVSEPAYRIDRLLTQWILSGRLARVRGIVIGKTEPVRGETEEDLCRVMADAGRRLSVPVWYGFPAGHAGPNVALPFGVRARIDAKGRLYLLEPPVAAP